MSKAKARKAAKTRIIWSERARADLTEIGDRIASHDPGAAERWVGKLIALIEQAGRVPMAGRVVPEVCRTEVRERILRRFRVVYRLREDGIEVVTIFEGHRQFPLDAIPDEE
jgi:plasmid stabilization system protein ParE